MQPLLRQLAVRNTAGAWPSGGMSNWQLKPAGRHSQRPSHSPAQTASPHQHLVHSTAISPHGRRSSRQLPSHGTVALEVQMQHRGAAANGRGAATTKAMPHLSAARQEAGNLRLTVSAQIARGGRRMACSKPASCLAVSARLSSKMIRLLAATAWVCLCSLGSTRRTRPPRRHCSFVSLSSWPTVDRGLRAQ